MLDRIADLIIKRPWLYIALFSVVTVFFAAQFPGLEVDPELKNELPADMPSRVALDKIEELFGGTDLLVVAVSAHDVLEAETLSRVHKISKRMERMKEFDKVLSVFTLKDIKGKDGAMTVDPAVKRIPRSVHARERLRAELRENSQVYGRVLSKDFKHTAIIGFVSENAADETILDKVGTAIEENPGPGEILIGGAPFLRFNKGNDIRNDMRKFMPLGLLAMMIFLFACFRQVRGVLLPFIVTVMGIIVAMGLIPLLGWKIMVVTVILPVLLVAVANDYGIHMFSRYQEDNAPGTELTSRQLAKKGIVEMSRPVLLTGITTIAGLLCLLNHVLISAKQMAVLASVGIGFALLGSIVFIPAVLALLPKAKSIALGSDGHRTKAASLERLLYEIAKVVSRNPKKVLIAVLAVAVLSLAGIPLIVVDTNSVNYYPAESLIARSAHLINDNFGGAFSVSIVSEGDIKSPSVLHAIDDFQNDLERHQNVDVTNSIAEIVRDMNKAMHDGDDAYDRIPERRNTIAEYFLLYSMSGDPGDFDKLVDFPYEHAGISARINDVSTSAIKAVVEYAQGYVKDHPDGPFTIVGGRAAQFAEMVDCVIKGQVLSLLMSMVIISLLVGLLFRSPVAGLLASVPLSLAMAILFGLMGFLNIYLNTVTAMLSSIMIGVGVDYTVHFLWRYKREREARLPPAEAVKVTLITTGRGIIFNALSVVVGFAVLMISAFLPVRFFGFLVLVSISSCLIGALVLLPAVVIVFRPRFLEPVADVRTYGESTKEWNT
jgi:hydrophobe/amphiphile efflux-3 (HAE3) family protein